MQKHSVTEYIQHSTGFFRCRACCSAAPGIFHEKIRREIVNAFGGKCIICGYSKCIRALDFHHIDPTTKELNLSLKGLSRSRVFREAEKCVLLCSNCHREVEAGVTLLPSCLKRFDATPYLSNIPR